MESLVKEQTGLDFATFQGDLVLAKEAAKKLLQERGVRGIENLVGGCPSVGHLWNLGSLLELQEFATGLSLILPVNCVS